MPSITLKDGPFGAGVEVTVNEKEFFLPDPARPGLREVVPFTAVEAIDSVADDRSGQYKEALWLGLKGFSSAGPVGLAASLLAVQRTKTVVFSVRLKDGRSFVATTDAAGYAAIHGHYLAARRGPTPEADNAEERAAEERAVEAIIARYMAGKADAAARPAQATPGESTRPSAAAARSVFGRRRS